MYWKKIPKTNIYNYISGYEALNIPNENGDVADWHPETYLSSKNPNEYIKTYKLDETIGTIGIENKIITFPNKSEVYIANFIRSIIDIIIFSERDIEIKSIFGCKNDFLTDQESYELFEKLIELLEKRHKKSDKIIMFLKNEYPKKYYEYKLKGSGEIKYGL